MGVVAGGRAATAGWAAPKAAEAEREGEDPEEKRRIRRPGELVMEYIVAAPFRSGREAQPGPSFGCLREDPGGVSDRGLDFGGPAVMGGSLRLR